MLGAIAGDIIGSVYEGKKRWLVERRVDFEPLFDPRARFTDDTVRSVAVADALMHRGDLADTFREYYHRYPGAGFGGEFRRWAESGRTGPYGSWGNGSAMRVGPVARMYDSPDEVLARAGETARVTHDHPEGIKGARATALATFLARAGAAKGEIRDEVGRRFGYDLSRSVDEIRPGHGFDASCRGTVPPALMAFLDSTSYEHAVRLAVSLGGDADALACIAGGVAAAFYGGVPPTIGGRARLFLDDDLLAVVAEFEARYPPAAGAG